MSGLELPGTLVLGTQQQQQLHTSWSTSEEVLNQLSSWGFPPLQRPAYASPTISPQELSSIDNQRYTEIYASTVAWLNFTENVFLRVKTVVLETKNELERVVIDVQRAALAEAHDRSLKKPSKDYLEKLSEAHPRYAHLSLQLQKYQQQQINMEGHFNALVRQEKLISRAIELRRLTVEGNRVGSNIPARRGY